MPQMGWMCKIKNGDNTIDIRKIAFRINRCLLAYEIY